MNVLRAWLVWGAVWLTVLVFLLVFLLATGEIGVIAVSLFVGFWLYVTRPDIER